jgi:hypothetical protein
MSLKVSKLRVLGIGEVALLVYLLVVIGVSLVQAVAGWPSVSALASSPLLLWQGQWWRLLTSGLVVNGPPVPQLAAIGALGTLVIYFGGSWLFWRVAVAGHLIGTVFAYAWFGVFWLAGRAEDTKLLTSPDYGVSLIWSAGLGAFAAWAWMGPKATLHRPWRPSWVILALVVMFIVTLYSDDMEALQHVVAFGVGAAIISTAGRARVLHRERRPLVRVGH